MAEAKKYMNENQDTYDEKQTNVDHKKHTQTTFMDHSGQGLIDAVKYWTSVPFAIFNASYHIFKGTKKIRSYYDFKNSVYVDTCVIPNDLQVILFIGETGAGKTSTLNTIKNVLANVKYKDNERHKFVDESKMNKNAAKSQTENVNIFMTDKYAFIDTPGINDTDGKDKDNDTIEEIKKLLDKKLNHIHAICFVIKYSDNRLNDPMKYVIKTVVGLFAKDVIDNAYIIAAHCNSDKPKPPTIIANHETLNKIKKKHIFYVNNEPFMNPPDIKDEAPIDPDSDSDDSAGSNPHQGISASELMFNMTTKSLKKFFKKVNKGERVATSLTKEVIRAKILINAHIDTLNSTIMKKLMKIKALLDAKNTNVKGLRLTYKEELIDVDYWCMHCPVCKHNCHKNCYAWWKNCCEVINWSKKCSQCIEGCHKSLHKVEKKIWNFELSKIAMNEDNISPQLQDIESELYGRIAIIFIYVTELNKIAFHPMEYSLKQKIDSLIADETSQETPHKALIEYLVALKNDNTINAIERYCNNIIQNNNIQFSELNQEQLNKYFKGVQDKVKTVRINNQK